MTADQMSNQLEAIDAAAERVSYALTVLRQAQQSRSNDDDLAQCTMHELETVLAFAQTDLRAAGAAY